MFFENADGLHFKSIDSLFAQEHAKSYVYGGQPESSLAYDGEIVNLFPDNRFVANEKLRILNNMMQNVVKEVESEKEEKRS